MINEIKLHNMLPLVFKSGKMEHGKSDVWKTSVTFHHGERYLIEAASGTGKTSLCSYIMGMRSDFEGDLIIDGKNSRHFSTAYWTGLRRDALAWLPQEIGLFENLTLWENLIIKNRLTNRLSQREILDLIERLGLTEKIDTPAKFLSIGQQQRAGFIRMLCQPADFLLLDEPVSHLDGQNNLLMTEILEETLKATGAGVIITSVGNRMALSNLKELTL